MQLVLIVLEMMLGLFLLMSGCLFIRTLLLEIAPSSRPHRQAPQGGWPAPDPVPLHRGPTSAGAGTGDPDYRLLEANGVTACQIAALLRLKKWYEAGEGDRAALVSRWETLKDLFRCAPLDARADPEGSVPDDSF